MMTDETEAPQGDVIEEVPVADEPQGGPDPEVAALAKSRGWKPPEDWVGDRKNLIEDPQEFNRLYEERMPSILRENRGLHSELNELRSAVESMADWRARMDEANAKQLEKELKSLEGQLKQAVDAGDHRLTNDIIARRDELKAEPKAPAQPQVNPDVDPAFQRWVNSSDASWYRERGNDKNDPYVVYGMKVAEELSRQGISYKTHGVSYYEEISRQVQEAFKAPQAKAQVEGGGRQPAKSKPAKVQSWNQLPQDVRDAPHVNQIVSKMYMKAAGGDEAKARNLYAKDWQNRKEAEN